MVMVVTQSSGTSSLQTTDRTSCELETLDKKMATCSHGLNSLPPSPSRSSVVPYSLLTRFANVGFLLAAVNQNQHVNNGRFPFAG